MRNLRPLALIVDDNQFARKIYQAVAKNLCIDAHIAETAYEALEAVKVLRFDAILMDWQMPDIDGIECAKLIREWQFQVGQARTPIIMVTARGLESDKIECYDAGLDDYLAKPFSLDELQNKLSYWLELPV